MIAWANLSNKKDCIIRAIGLACAGVVYILRNFIYFATDFAVGFSCWGAVDGANLVGFWFKR